jgi:hypothetical protein
MLNIYFLGGDKNGLHETYADQIKENEILVFDGLGGNTSQKDHINLMAALK